MARCGRNVDAASARARRVPLVAAFVLLLQRVQASEPTLEELAYLYGTDKSKDDHKYVDLYSMIFDPIRHLVHNVTEVGVAGGQSLQMWHDYFTKADIYGIDHIFHKTLIKHFGTLPRVHLHKTNAYAWRDVDTQRLRWADETMDVIIDDALHTQKFEEQLIRRLWRFVKPGGFYIIEDVGMNHADTGTLKEWLEELPHDFKVENILEDAQVVYVDPLIGHRNLSAYANVSIHGWHVVRSRLNHQSSMVVIRKRLKGHPARPWKKFFGEADGAMTHNFIFEYRKRHGQAINGSDSLDAETAATAEPGNDRLTEVVDATEASPEKPQR